MNYAIVDIETTGGHASQNRILEIAIVVTDGVRVLRTFESLINPGKQIPGFISGLTGIDKALVEEAPSFKKVAADIYQLLKDCIFVAHNVNFDFSFVRNELLENGFVYDPPKLCTLRLSRKIFPGYKYYSLGNICGSLGIDTEQRHRAMGDAKAAFQLLQKIISSDTDNEIAKALKRNNGENKLPPNLPKKEFDLLPTEAGVYYFWNDQRKIIYIGKAVNIKKRVTSHFTGNVKTPQRQAFLREIHHITFELTGNELIALLHESSEIRAYWPKYNRSQKKPERNYGIFEYIGMDGYSRFAIDVVNKHNNHPISRFDSLSEAHDCLMRMISEHQLCLVKTSVTTTANIKDECRETCFCKKGASFYNKQVKRAKDELLLRHQNFAVTAVGRNAEELSFILVKEGLYRGFGFIPSELFSLDLLEKHIKPAKHNHSALPAIESFTSRFDGEYKRIEIAG